MSNKDEFIGSFDWELKHFGFLIEGQIRLGQFQRKYIEAKRINAPIMRKHRIPYEDKMTPEEQLFADLFNHEIMFVKDMSDLELEAHREKLVKTAKEARVKLTAVDAVKKDRAKAKNGKSTGFERSVSIDEISSDAINSINARKQKLTKIEKTIEGLVNLGMSREDAEKMCSAGAALNQLRKNGDNKPAATITIPFQNTTEQQALINQQDVLELAETQANEQIEKEKKDKVKTFVNPFVNGKIGG
jgi:hypothetical protein